MIIWLKYHLEAMVFCWKRFRHFLATYVALGIVATATHGAVMIFSLNALADENIPNVVIESEETPTPEPIPADIQGIESETSEDNSPTDTIEPNPDTEISEENLNDTLELPTESPTTPTEEPALEPEPTPIPEPESPSEPTPEPTPTPESETPAPVTSWPEERLEPENSDPIVVEEVIESPHSEVRSIIESVTPKLDWLYTLRAGAAYEEISHNKTTILEDSQALINDLEINNASEGISSRFCSIHSNLEQLETLYAAGSDATQPEIDAKNTDILHEIVAAFVQVRTIWIEESGTNWQCSN